MLAFLEAREVSSGDAKQAPEAGVVRRGREGGRERAEPGGRAGPSAVAGPRHPRHLGPGRLSPWSGSP